MVAEALTPEQIHSVVIGTAGHIDHGKSTIVRRLTGIDPDRLPEEQERGMTIDLGFAPFRLKSGRYVGLIDVPGHERFVKNMVAGATGIDIVMLVVAADDGIMPQTREHLSIMGLLGLCRGMIVLNKIDLVEPDMRDLVEEEIRSLVAGTFLQDAPILKVSGATGEGLDALVDKINEMVAQTTPREEEGYFRMPIQRVFSAKGFGTIVTGVPLTGAASLGDTVEILPLGRRGRVRHLQAYKHDVPRIRAGHSSALNVADVAHTEVNRGDVAATPGIFTAVTAFEAHMRYLPERGRPLRHLMPVRVHVGTKEAIGRVALLDSREMAPGAEGFVQVRLDEPVCVAPGDPYILRLQSPVETIGGGRVVDASNRKVRRFHTGVQEFLARARQCLDDPAGRAALEMERMTEPVDADRVARAARVLPPVAAQVIADLRGAGKLREVDGKFIHEAAFRSELSRLLERVEEFHGSHPMRVGMEAPILKQEFGAPEALFALLLKEAAKSGELIVENDRARRPHHGPKVSREDQEALKAMEDRIRAGGTATPNEQDLYQGLRFGADRLKRMLALLVDQGVVLALKDGVYIHGEVMKEARNKIVEELKAAGGVEPGRVKDLLKTSRKYVIPILERLDEEGVTKRVGNQRVLKEAKR